MYFEVLYHTRIWLSLFARSDVLTRAEKKSFRSSEIWLCVDCEAGTNVSQHPAVSTFRAEEYTSKPFYLLPIFSAEVHFYTEKKTEATRRVYTLTYPKDEHSRSLRNVVTYLQGNTVSLLHILSLLPSSLAATPPDCSLWQTYFLFPLVSKFSYSSGQWHVLAAACNMQATGEVAGTCVCCSVYGRCSKCIEYLGVEWPKMNWGGCGRMASGIFEGNIPAHSSRKRKEKALTHAGWDPRAHENLYSHSVLGRHGNFEVNGYLYFEET